MSEGPVSDAPAVKPRWRPSHNPWAVAMTVTLATFMEMLDTSIANVALPHISGSLGAGQDESTWVLTSYLVANAIILPMSSWMSLIVGRKRFYMSCVFCSRVVHAVRLCTVASAAHLFPGTAGRGGRWSGPSEQAILADTFAPEKRGMAFAIYGMAVVVARCSGPYGRLHHRQHSAGAGSSSSTCQ